MGIEDNRVRPINYEVITELDENINLNKKDLTAGQWKQLTLEWIKNNYRDAFVLYTDASKKDNEVGFGITNGIDINLKYKLDGNLQITNAELIAIINAILIATESTQTKIVICTDSKESCRAICKGQRENYLINLIWKLISERENKFFFVQWIPSHCGIEGNEKAD